MTARHETAELFLEAWMQFAARFPSGTVDTKDGVVAALANFELPFFNACFHERPLEDGEELRRCLRTSKQLAADCAHPWFFVLCEDWAPVGWEAVVAEEQLQVSEFTTGMACDELAPPRRPLPEVELRRVDDLATARDVAELNGLAYGMPHETIECLFNLHLWDDDSHGYVAYLAGEPVSCAAAFPIGGTIYMALVATHPEHGRKGLAEVVMRHAIQQAEDAHGLARTTLHASEAGRPLYAAMGYEAAARFHFITEPLPEA